MIALIITFETYVNRIEKYSERLGEGFIIDHFKGSMRSLHLVAAPRFPTIRLPNTNYVTPTSSLLRPYYY